MEFNSPAQYADISSMLSDELQASINNTRAIQAQAAAAAARGTDKHGHTVLSLQTALLSKLESENFVQSAMESMDYVALTHELARTAQASIRQQMELSKQIAADKAVSIFDDPLQAIINEFTLPWKQQELAGIQDITAQASSGLDFINKKMQDTARTADITRRTVTEASMANMLEATQANIDQLVLDARAKAESSNADKVRAAMTANKEQLHAWQVQKQEDRQEQLYRKQAAAIDRQLAKENDEAKREAAELRFVELAVRDSGGVFDPEAWKIRTKNDPLFRALRERGMEIASRPPNAPEAPIGYDPVSRLEYRALVNVPPTTGAARTLQELEVTALEEAKKQPGIKKDQVPGESDKVFKALVAAKQANIKAEDHTNPFALPAWSVMNTQAAISSDPVWKKYIAPTITSSIADVPTDPNKVLGILQKAMVSGEITPDRASELINYMAVSGAALNTNVHQLEKQFNLRQERYGYKLPPEFSSGFIANEISQTGTAQFLDPKGSVTRSKLATGNTFDLMNRTETDYLAMRLYLSGLVKEGKIGSIGARTFIQQIKSIPMKEEDKK